MEITNLKEFIEKVKLAFPNCKFEFQTQGAGWARCFVINRNNGCTIGRINFQPTKDGTAHTIYGTKFYKPDDYEYHPDDAFFYQFDTWVTTGKIIQIDHLVEIAKENKRKIIEQKLAWRKANPFVNSARRKKRHRKGLCENWMGEFRRLVCEEMSKI